MMIQLGSVESKKLVIYYLFSESATQTRILGTVSVAAMAEAAPLVNLRIPNELLTIIFQFLPFADLKNALLVCRLAIETKKEDFVLFSNPFQLLKGGGGRLGSSHACGLHLT